VAQLAVVLVEPGGNDGGTRYESAVSACESKFGTTAQPWANSIQSLGAIGGNLVWVLRAVCLDSPHFIQLVFAAQYLGHRELVGGGGREDLAIYAQIQGCPGLETGTSRLSMLFT
jgi:hypothetical protein